MNQKHNALEPQDYMHINLYILFDNQQLIR